MSVLHWEPPFKVGDVVAWGTGDNLTVGVVHPPVFWGVSMLTVKTRRDVFKVPIVSLRKANLAEYKFYLRSNKK